MAHFAALLIFLSWLLFGTMPVMASVPVAGMAVAGHSHTQTSEQPGMENHAAHLHDPSAEAPISGAAKVHVCTNCLAASCAACLTILPKPPVLGAFASNVSYRLATFAPTLRAGRPAPLERPPRIRMF